MYTSVAETSYPLLNPPINNNNVNQTTTGGISSRSIYGPTYPNITRNQNIGDISTEKSKGWLFRVAVFSTIAFVVLSQSVAYKVVNSIYGMVSGNYDYIMSEEGCPTAVGIVTQATVFFAFMLVILF